MPLLAALGICSAAATAQSEAPAQPTIAINVLNERHEISPYVYGGNWPNIDKGSNFIQTTGTRLSRWGGNSTSSHNWKLDLRNTAADWYFENFGDSDSIQWVKQVEAQGSDAIVGIAMLDWTPKASDTHSFSVAKYGPQQKTDPERPDCGNGVRPDGKTFVVNDPNDAYVPLRDRQAAGDPPGTIYRDEWIARLKDAFADRPHFYEFDNEPEIWNGTHRDVHPAPSTYEEMRDKFLDMANLIESIDSKAIITGPTTCGWWFYWNSAAGGSDKSSHGNMDYLPWWLSQVAAADRKSGHRTLGVFDLHAYPDYNGGGTPEQADASRLRAPRAYWDPTCESEGSTGTTYNATQTQPDMTKPAIIPRFRAMVNAIYPGTKFGITEWGYFQDDNVAASLAEAEDYGVFGREKLYMATRFCSPAPQSICSLSLEMYKNFAPISVQDITNLDPNAFGSYAAVSGDGRQLTVMAINKDPKNAVTARIEIDGFSPATMTAYEREGADKSITTSPSVAAPESYTFAPYSQTLLVFQGTQDTGVVDWSIDRDCLMLIAGSRATLHVVASASRGNVHLLKVDAADGVAMTISGSRVSPAHGGTIDVVAGADPGFYRFTVTGKTSAGRVETQSGWIVVGKPGSLPDLSGS
jgi:hypothetical protein